jgi:hypothetical protein
MNARQIVKQLLEGDDETIEGWEHAKKGFVTLPSGLVVDFLACPDDAPPQNILDEIDRLPKEVDGWTVQRVHFDAWDRNCPEHGGDMNYGEEFSLDLVKDGEEDRIGVPAFIGRDGWEIDGESEEGQAWNKADNERRSAQESRGVLKAKNAILEAGWDGMYDVGETKVLFPDGTKKTVPVRAVLTWDTPDFVSEIWSSRLKTSASNQLEVMTTSSSSSVQKMSTLTNTESQASVNLIPEMS